MGIVSGRFVLPSKNIQADARINLGDGLAVEDRVDFSSAILWGNFPHFIPNLHGQGARERKGDCNRKKVAPVNPMSRDNECEKN